MTNNKDKWLRALQAKGIRTTQDEVGRAGRHRHDDPGGKPAERSGRFSPGEGKIRQTVQGDRSQGRNQPARCMTRNVSARS